MSQLIEVKTDLRKFNQARQQVQKAIEAMTMKVSEPKDLPVAADILKKATTVKKLIEDKRKELTKPLFDGQKNVNAVAKEITDGLESALKEFKGRILTVQQAEMKRIEDERKAKEAEAEAARIKEEQSGETDFTETKEAVQEVKEVKKEEQILRSTVRTRKIWKFRITDETKIPREYLTPDTVKINSMKPTGDQDPPKIKGIEFYQETSVV